MQRWGGGGGAHILQACPGALGGLGVEMTGRVCPSGKSKVPIEITRGAHRSSKPRNICVEELNRRARSLGKSWEHWTVLLLGKSTCLENVGWVEAGGGQFPVERERGRV